MSGRKRQRELTSGYARTMHALCVEEAAQFA